MESGTTADDPKRGRSKERNRASGERSKTESPKPRRDKKEKETESKDGKKRSASTSSRKKTSTKKDAKKGTSSSPPATRTSRSASRIREKLIDNGEEGKKMIIKKELIETPAKVQSIIEFQTQDLIDMIKEKAERAKVSKAKGKKKETSKKAGTAKGQSKSPYTKRKKPEESEIPTKVSPASKRGTPNRYERRKAAGRGGGGGQASQQTPRTTEMYAQ